MPSLPACSCWPAAAICSGWAAPWSCSASRSKMPRASHTASLGYSSSARRPLNRWRWLYWQRLPHRCPAAAVAGRRLRRRLNQAGLRSRSVIAEAAPAHHETCANVPHVVHQLPRVERPPPISRATWRRPSPNRRPASIATSTPGTVRTALLAPTAVRHPPPAAPPPDRVRRPPSTTPLPTWRYPNPATPAPTRATTP